MVTHIYRMIFNMMSAINFFFIALIICVATNAIHEQVADAFTTTIQTQSSSSSRTTYHHHPSPLRSSTTENNNDRLVSTNKRKRATITTTATTIRQGPPAETKPDYASISGPMGSLVDSILMSLFRYRLSQRLNRSDNPIITPDSQLPLNDFLGIIDLTTRMNSQHQNRTTVQTMAQDVLVSLFPSFILDRYPSWFARPFPEFSARMCAWATVVGGTWLMGECHVNDVDIDATTTTTTTTTSSRIDNNNETNTTNNNKTSGKKQGVLVKRCRFLEEAQCASICVNSCKIPTQKFFRENMGLPLTMTPDYETFECQFAFGTLPNEEEERLAKDTPCLGRCPSRGGMRSWHNGSGDGGGEEEEMMSGQQWLEDLKALGELQQQGVKNEMSGSSCSLMED